MHFEIRPALSSDAKQFIDLVETLEAETDFLLHESGERTYDLSEQETILARRLDGQRSETLLAIDRRSGSLAGFLMLQGYPPKKLAHRAKIVMAVRNEMHRQGAGTSLLACAENLVSINGLRKLELTVRTDNFPAISLYLKTGFQIIGLHREALFSSERFHDEYLMEKFVRDKAS